VRRRPKSRFCSSSDILVADFIAERKHTQTLPLTTLSDSRLGIDAAYYITQLLENPAGREPLLAATGGAPLTLTTRIEADLRLLDRLRIKPVFVFPGLTPNRRQRNLQQNDYSEACRARHDAWAKYESGNEEQATRLFDSRSCIQHWDLWRSILRIFRHRNVEFMVAPYLPWAQVRSSSNSPYMSLRSPQLLYLLKHPKSYIHAIYASSDALLYISGVEKLITSLNLTSTSPTFTYVAKPKLLADLGVNEEQFLDVGILAGFQHSPAFPPIAHDGALKSTVDMIKHYKTGFSTVTMYGEHPGVKAMNYVEHFARTRTMMKFSLIFSSEGSVTPLPLAIPSHNLTASDIPSDFHEVYTHRLPDEAFFYLSRGLLGPQVLDWLTSGFIIEPPPLDNGETTEYKRFVKEVITEGQTGPRATALALLSSVLHNFWSTRRVQGCFWFENHMPGGPKNFNNVSHNSKETAALAERVTGWNVPYGVIEEELRRQNVRPSLSGIVAEG
jgi:hypothetical protein